jgi:hypothetical protein
MAISLQPREEDIPTQLNMSVVIFDKKKMTCHSEPGHVSFFISVHFQNQRGHKFRFTSTKYGCGWATNTHFHPKKIVNCRKRHTTCIAKGNHACIKEEHQPASKEQLSTLCFDALKQKASCLGLKLMDREGR